MNSESSSQTSPSKLQLHSIGQLPQKYRAAANEAFAHTENRTDTLMRILILVCFGLNLFLAPFYNSWFVGIAVGGLATLAFFITSTTMRHSFFHKVVAGAAFAVMGAAYVYQMHGLFEMHFSFFIMATILIMYRDWRVFIPVTIIIVGHHSLFAYLQNSGFTAVYFTQLDYMPASALAFHFGMYVLHTVVCVWWALRLKRQKLLQVVNTYDLQNQLRFNEQNIAFANAIAQNNYDLDYQANDEDTLGQSLVTMRQHLKESAAKDKAEAWITSGLNTLSNILRQDANQLSNLSNALLQHIVKHLDLNQGALFTLEYEHGPAQGNNGTEAQGLEQAHLHLQAMYAWNRRKYMDKRIEIGEGLTGQAVLERESIYLTEIPQNYIEISSGLGGAQPQAIFIQPLMYNEQIVGVLELASLHNISLEAQQFIARAAESIAAAILSSRVNAQTQQLLQDSQELTEQMQAQEEEMRQNMEELQSTQEEVKRKEVEMTQHLNAINEAMGSAEVLPNGQLRSMNAKLQDLLGMYNTDFKALNFNDLLTFSQDQNQEKQKLAQAMANGKTYRLRAQLKGAGGNPLPVNLTYAPALNNQQKVVKYIVLVAEVLTNELETTQVKEKPATGSNLQTEKHLQQNIEELQATQETLTQQKNQLEAQLHFFNAFTYQITLDSLGIIQQVSPKVAHKLGFTEEELQGKNLKSIVPNPEVVLDMLAQLKLNNQGWEKALTLQGKAPQQVHLHAFARQYIANQQQERIMLAGFSQTPATAK